MECYCLMVTETLFLLMNKLLNYIVVDGCVTLWLYLMPLTSTLKNDETSKFYVIRILLE